MATRALRSGRLPNVVGQIDWPPNMWMGVSVEHAATMPRIDHLRPAPATVRFLSWEPLIRPLVGVSPFDTCASCHGTPGLVCVSTCREPTTEQGRT